MNEAVFIKDNFLLENKQAERLYYEYAKGMPIIDYHCHLQPHEVAENKKWDNLTQVWLYGDHYKWRALRTNGIEEKYCTGDATDYEKFEKLAETMPSLLRNPIYHWSHLELARYFGITDRLLGPDTAKGIWDDCNKLFDKGEITAHKLMKKSNVKLVCTTDDPIDSLEHHISLKNSDFDIQMLPTWRPDKAMAVESAPNFNKYLEKLSSASNIEITNFEDFINAIQNRHDFFHSVGCRLSDRGLETCYADDYTESEIKNIFNKIHSGSELDKNEILKFKSAMLFQFGVMDAEKDWTMQIHYGVIRNNNSRMFKKLGPDTGFDSIGDFEIARPLAKMLDRMDSINKLPKTILYNINPRDNELLATMLGNFQDGSIAGKLQLGSGWWFLDQKNGMEKQIEALSQLGLLSKFIGMLTDSRSFLSYTRHEYFRRILCNILGNDISKGLIPSDFKLVGEMVKDICYRNAESYFGFNL